MRLRWQRRVRKQLRRMRGHDRILPVTVAKFERRGLLLVEALRCIMLDPAHFHLQRAAIGKLLAVAGNDEAVQALLALFFEQTDKDELYATALTLESLDDRRAVPGLIHALLEAGIPHRRCTAS